LLANREAGYLRFTVNESNELMAEPLTQEVPWPKNSLEKRLFKKKTYKVSQLVSEWLTDKSGDIYNEIIDFFLIIQTIKGTVQVKQSKWTANPSYSWSEAGMQVIQQTTPPDIGNLLNPSSEEDLLLKKQLNTAIAQGISNNKGKKDDRINPWKLESEVNRQKHIKVGWPYLVIIILVSTLVITVLASLYQLFFSKAAVFKPEWLLYFLLGNFVLMTLFFLILLFRKDKIQQPIWNVWQFVRMYFRQEYKARSTDQNISFVLFGLYLISLLIIPLIGFTITGLVLGLSSLSSESVIGSIIVLFLLLLLILVLVHHAKKTFQKIFVQSINSVVTEKAATKTAESVKAPILAVKAKPEKSLKASNTHSIPIHIEFISENDFPTPSELSLKRYQAVHDRFPRLIQAYLKHSWWLATAVFLISCIYASQSNSAWIIALALSVGVPTLGWFALYRFGSNLYKKIDTVSGQTIRRLNKDTMNKSFLSKPNITPFISYLWVGISIVVIISMLSQGLKNYILFGLLIVVNILFFLRLNKAMKTLEAEFPVYSPPRLLVLRIFSSASFPELMGIIQAWRSLGITQFLDGPDSAGNDIGDVKNFVTGQLHDSIVENQEELDASIRSFGHLPNNDLQFPMHSVQCNDATWKEALEAFLQSSDVIILDISGMSNQNKGILYEINKIVREIQLDKVLFLMNDQTDQQSIKLMIEEAVKKITPESVNYLSERINIRIFQHSGNISRRSNESEAEWKNRLNIPDVSERLVGMLMDIAYSSSSTSTIDEKIELKWSRWSIKDLRFTGISVE